MELSRTRKHLDTLVLFHCWPYVPPIIDPEQHVGLLGDAVDRHPTGHLPFPVFRLPRGEFDLAEICERNNLPKVTNLFLCLDATVPYEPRNLKAHCENVFLILGDSHHLPSPISRLRSYLMKEKFDGVIFTNNARHRRWFADLLNVSRIYFEPGIFSVEPSKVGAIISQGRRDDREFQPAPPIIYGQLGPFHPRRCRLAPTLIDKGLLRHISGPWEELRDAMSNALASVNITLNADLNSRVFEVAETGCPLVIDKLGAENGFGTVLIPEYNSLVFNTNAELEAILSDWSYLHTVRNTVGKRLQADYKRYWSPAAIRNKYLTNISNPWEAFKTDFPRKKSVNDELPGIFSLRLKIYEDLQELHRQYESIDLVTNENFIQGFESEVDCLPRIRVCHLSQARLSDDSVLTITAQFDDAASCFKLFRIESPQLH